MNERVNKTWLRRAVVCRLKEEGQSDACCETRMNLEDIVLGGGSHTKEDGYWATPPPRGTQRRQTYGHRREKGGRRGLGGRPHRELSFAGYRVSVCRMERCGGQLHNYVNLPDATELCTPRNS